ncbi:MAG TPA: hypothetical protein VLX28_28490 [Thermoanaerobaculia bacterium]|nr:hypothetical protein [Thermoanaerobaculia bacterium]
MPHVNRRVLACTVLLIALAATAMSLIAVPNAEAASCSPQGATRWLYNGCCAGSRTAYLLQWCNNGVWTNTTTTDCRPVCRF